MLANYLAAAFRNLMRNRLHSAITTVSLAVGFTVMILVTVFWRNERTYDQFWPNADSLYMAMGRELKDGAPSIYDDASSRLTPLIAAVPGVEAISRMVGETVKITMGPTEYELEETVWTDPNIFDLLPVKAIRGDPRAAVADPGSAVISKSIAEKLFGANDPMGRPLTITTIRRDTPQTFTVTVGAVIEDRPRQTHLQPGFLYLSGNSALARQIDPTARALTYFRVRKDVQRENLERDFAALSARHIPPVRGVKYDVAPIPIKDAYLRPGGDNWFSQSGGDLVRSSGEGFTTLFFALGSMVLIVAAINFVTLMTARGAGRAVEVGVRKASGGRRRDLVLQFIGEALIYTTLAFLTALALSELVLPLVSKLVDAEFSLNYIEDFGLVAGLGLAALGVGLAAGLYPALALSSFRPAVVLKGGLPKTPGSALLRQILLTAQFTPLVLLALGAVTANAQLFRSIDNASTTGDINSVMIREPCTSSLRARMAVIPGVKMATCLEYGGQNIGMVTGALGIGQRVQAEVKGKDGRRLEAQPTLADTDSVTFHGLKLIAGRFWTSPTEAGVVVNETAARNLGYSNPRAALGQPVEWKETGAPIPSGSGLSLSTSGGPAVAAEANDPVRRFTIIGVTADRGGFADYEAPLYYQDATAKRRLELGLRVNDAKDPALLKSLDAAWAETGALRPMQRQTYIGWLEEAKLAMGQIFGLLNGIVITGLVIAALGLFGLAAFLAEQRTKEVGVRKALGASRATLMRMLVFQFARPVIIANLIAVPLVWLGLNVVMGSASPNERFVAPAWIYLLVTGASLVLAVAATFIHAWRVTGQRPVMALRYE